MRPAFSSTKQAAAFALLLLLVLLSPLWAGKKLLPPREEAYSTQSWGSGPYPWIENQIFQETNDIDIAFMGSSRILHALDTPYVEDQLSKQLGRPAVVRTLAWGGAGYDGLYLIARDLFAHRRVRILVIYDENPSGYRNTQLPSFFEYGRDAGLIAGLPLNDQGLYYFAAVVGMPRNLLNLLRPNLPAPLVSNPPNYWEQHYGSASIVKLRGATKSRLGFSYDTMGDNFTAFTPFTPHTGVTPADTEVYSADHPGDFKFGNATLPAWQIAFATRLSELAATNSTRLVMLTIPVLADAAATNIQQRARWAGIFKCDFWLVGLPPAKMFNGLTDQQLHWLFTNRGHFNENGMTYFTPLVTPTLLKIYEAAPHH
jgi:hypothetical protein